MAVQRVRTTPVSKETQQAWEEYLVQRAENEKVARARIEREFPPFITVRIASYILSFVETLLLKNAPASSEKVKGDEEKSA